jgi:hypothetical protein
MAIKYTKWPYNIPTSSIARLFKIYPNWDFGFENIPSGKPVPELTRALQISVTGLTPTHKSESMDKEAD